jgi:hypothetical protein
MFQRIPGILGQVKAIIYYFGLCKPSIFHPFNNDKKLKNPNSQKPKTAKKKNPLAIQLFILDRRFYLFVVYVCVFVCVFLNYNYQSFTITTTPKIQDSKWRY